MTNNVDQTASGAAGAREIREVVAERYSALARLALAGERPVDCDPEAFTEGCFGAAGYADAEDVPAAARRASLGCGNPVAVAGLSQGETVLDLGSGAGLDVLLSARRVAPNGKVYGLDASTDMLSLARSNAEQAGVANVELLHGHIEDIPLSDSQVDAVISNCVINLSADKPRVLAEAFRVLRPGGRFGVSDVIAADDLDPAQRAAAEHRVGCTTGTLTADEYRDLLLEAGFSTAEIIPTHDAGGGLTSAIVHATRPAAPPGTLIRTMSADEAVQVLAIYQDGLDTGNASFETLASTWDRWDATHLLGHRHVAVEETGQLLGWVALSAVSDRCVYAGVAEESVYVHPQARGRGIGAALLQAVIDSSETAGIWTLQTGIFPENTTSLALHARAGFRIVGTRERVGQHHGRWRDVVFLERRSAVAGT
jgi:L-amino acid N-acyltransferase YncA/2-polyprenyl-3-methyl-5-hydroxy-6-metoxy-1,4-benzoquinol methylase